MFDTAFGLPLHPLLVHLPVVLLPLSAVAMVLLVLAPSLRQRLAVPAFVLVAAGALGTVAAMLSGTAFVERVGDPGVHAQLGTALMVCSLFYLAIAGGWLLWVGRADRRGTLPAALGWLSALLSVGIIALTVATGHSGASAVWSGVVRADSSAPQAPSTAGPEASTGTEASPSPSTPATADASATASSAPTGITLAEVAEHGSADSCWAAVDGNVYDLTDWIGQHPGGQSHILALCGTDATAAFTSQHSGDARPAEELASMLLGPLAS